MGATVAFLISCFGLGCLAGLVFAILKITFSYIKNRILEKIRNGGKGKVKIDTVKRISAQVMEQSRDEGNTVSEEDLRKLFGAEGIIDGDMDENGHVDPETIRITKSDEIDDESREIFKKYNGSMTIPLGINM